MCTCRIVESPSRSEGPYRIEYCPMHRAANIMVGALKSFVRDRATCPTANGLDLQAWELMKIAIAAAEKGKDS